MTYVLLLASFVAILIAVASRRQIRVDASPTARSGQVRVDGRQRVVDLTAEPLNPHRADLQMGADALVEKIRSRPKGLLLSLDLFAVRIL
jgi:hypothetical protein